MEDADGADGFVSAAGDDEDDDEDDEDDDDEDDACSSLKADEYELMSR